MIVDGYVRVSDVGGRAGDSFMSPALQRQDIERWAGVHGFLIGHIFEEFDESGARRDRPLLELALQRIEQGESHGLVVSKLDRFGRSLLDGLTAIGRIEKAGGTFVSVQDGLDLATPTGRFVLRVMLSIAEWELDRIRATWMAAQARAVERGVHMGKPPIGYRRGPSGRLVVDPIFGPVVTELFRRRAEGEPISVLGRDLEDRGIETPFGGSFWHPATIRFMLQNRTYLGEVHHGRPVKKDAHPALTTRATWERVRLFPERPPTRQNHEPALLRGFVRCASCRRLMKAGSSRLPPVAGDRIYQCIGVTAGGRCPRQAAITAAVIEPYIEAVFWQELARRPRSQPAQKLERLQAEVERCEEGLARYRDNTKLAERLGAERFTAGVTARLREAEQAALELATVSARLPSEGSDAQELKRQWTTMGLPERRRAILEVLDCAFVVAGSRRPAHERLIVCARGGAPPDLPASRPGARDLSLRSVEVSECREIVQLREPMRVPSERSVRKRLKRFLNDQKRWPPFSAFQADGEGLLYRDVQMTGGSRRWSPELGVPWRPTDRELAGWTPDRIRRDLAVFVEGREHWPTAREFRAERRYELYAAVASTGGARYWAEQFGVSVRKGGTKIWTDARIEAELQEFTAGRKTYPTRGEFEDSGKLALWQTIRRNGSRRSWADRLGLAICPHYKWTPERIEAELREFIPAGSQFPPHRTFVNQGRQLLYFAMMRQGGPTYWAPHVEAAVGDRGAAPGQ